MISVVKEHLTFAKINIGRRREWAITSAMFLSRCKKFNIKNVPKNRYNSFLTPFTIYPLGKLKKKVH